MRAHLRPHRRTSPLFSSTESLLTAFRSRSAPTTPPPRTSRAPSRPASAMSSSSPESTLATTESPRPTRSPKDSSRRALSPSTGTLGCRLTPFFAIRIPYVAFIPASSQCTQFASAELYGPGVGGTPIVSPTTATTATASDVVTIQTSTGSAAATSTGATTTTGGSTGPLPTIGGTATTRSTGTAASTGAQSTTSTGAGAKLQVGGLLAGLMGLIVVV